MFAQLVHEFLGVPFESIRYVQGDTAQVPFGRGTYGARSAVVGGSALKRAADAIIDKAKPMAAAMMEADVGDIEFGDGLFKVAGTDKAIPLVEVAKASYAPMGPMTKFGIGLEGSGTHSPEPPSHPNGSHACEVEIDPETGEVTVERYIAVDDLGQVLNPMIVIGQMHGGVAQGIGQALYEHAIYDRDSAQLITGSFMDYAMPRADMLPNFDTQLEEVPCMTNPIGVKGIGESGTIGAPPVVINAIIDALIPARHRPHRHAGDGEQGVADDPEREGQGGVRAPNLMVRSRSEARRLEPWPEATAERVAILRDAAASPRLLRMRSCALRRSAERQRRRARAAGIAFFLSLLAIERSAAREPDGCLWLKRVSGPPTREPGLKPGF